MKIAAIATTKNEADVIEGFVRHNARFVDGFFFIDESVDATRTILGKLRDEGFDITVLGSSSAIYEQRILISSALRIIDELKVFDWAVLLDADEILPDVERPAFEEALARLPLNTLAVLNWKTFVPLSGDYFLCEDPLTENFLPRSSEGFGSPIGKICVPRSLFGSVMVQPGNHGACFEGNGAAVPAAALPFHLCHFPVRSIEQITVKNIVAAHVTSMKENKTAVEGWHVYASLEQMRARNFEVSYEELLRVALSYAIDQVPTDMAVNRGALPLRGTAMPMRYKDLRYRSPVAALDREMEAMARQVAMHRKAASASRLAVVEAQERLRAAVEVLDGTKAKP